MKASVQELLTGHGPLVPFFALVVVGVLVFLVASRLSRHADAVADETGLGGLWIGTVLLAASTSLPEVFTAVNAALLDAPDIGVGDILGANMVNMLILAALDLVFARRRILDHVHKEHAQFGLLGMVLMAMAGSAIIVGGWARIGHVGLETIMIAAVYLGVLRFLYRQGVQSRAVGLIDTKPVNRLRLRGAAVGFGLGTAGLLVLTPLLVLSAESISLETGISTTFVGTLLVGLLTTLPELSTTFSAIRLGAFNLAVGNLFGSVMFNLVILLLMDLAYARGPLLGLVTRDHLYTIVLGVALLALGVVAILRRGRPRALPFRIENILIVAIYLLGVFLLYRLGTP